MAMKRLLICTALIFLVAVVLALPAKAIDGGTTMTSGNVCDRFETAWSAKQAAYERAREVRKRAFENTKTRWDKLFDKLDAISADTAVLRVDADDAASKFESLIAADDALFAAMEAYGRANCEKEGVADAKKALKTAQGGRRTARQEYAKSLKQLLKDLAGLRSTTPTVNSANQ
ncbi:hypothetical protein A3A84_03985 [Candidatus Collierbacteria bacterium RIFCSPLOWO2_01_FULL_50_23]|uniref:DUF5667 domain-containing protein n=1 Tax=Candidatus Collierbacteria bacterium RIFCSPHIGHO2_01_FULL_50_25 TaxID=1817722 RepID=A0A1F5EX74_9BACT|nr:MAG: hypothetical protein A2703_03275 [Candidatus Collierbacteria bacterium RIFCSPHIGHO2_01_FULL_50_25]OGD74579.1 MAG: hypothetical protein A3A84_03985 [Candidatus Collierbacteria bacterium RIFCSPLOWO2_01_FULL_50_23]